MSKTMIRKVIKIIGAAQSNLKNGWAPLANEDLKVALRILHEQIRS